MILKEIKLGDALWKETRTFQLTLLHIQDLRDTHGNFGEENFKKEVCSDEFLNNIGSHVDIKACIKRE